jgi:membrane protease YdiL (CAAX protease family)
MKNKKEIDLKEVYNILGWVLVLIGISQIIIGISQIIIHEILWTKILAEALESRIGRDHLWTGTVGNDYIHAVCNITSHYHE